tara:strand:+ start:363 stop:734 length:372 start_codon:yes stop_codon:yes gene_type:complete
MEENVIVNAVSEYVPELSKQNDSNYYYLYEVTIQNKSRKKIKLLSRHWDISDGSGNKKKIDGDGVVGKNPIINPGEMFKYKSYCPLKTEFGFMSGFYTMKNDDGDVFKVAIPEFPLVLNNVIN